jgi:hypothetical protein
LVVYLDGGLNGHYVLFIRGVFAAFWSLFWSLQYGQKKNGFKTKPLYSYRVGELVRTFRAFCATNFVRAEFRCGWFTG